MNNPYKARIFIIANCDWIQEIEHNPNAVSPCDRWVAFHNQQIIGKIKKLEVKRWSDGEIVTFAKRLKKNHF